MSGIRDHSQERERLLACLVGGAAGDSLGCDPEFMLLEDIQARFPEGAGDPGSDCHKVRGAVTDDTRMTLFTAEGIIRAKAEAAASGIGQRAAPRRSGRPCASGAAPVAADAGEPGRQAAAS